MLRPFAPLIQLLPPPSPDAGEDAGAPQHKSAPNADDSTTAPSYDEILRQRPEARDLSRKQVNVKDQALTSQPAAPARERSGASTSGISVALAIAIGAGILLTCATAIGYLLRRNLKRFLYMRGLIDDPY